MFGVQNHRDCLETHILASDNPIIKHIHVHVNLPMLISERFLQYTGRVPNESGHLR